MTLLLLKLIAITTAVSGAAVIVAPHLILDLISTQDLGSSSAYLFGIVGMFMLLFGGMLLHALRGPEVPRVPLLWVGLQKLGAAIAVALGVVSGTFVPLSLLIAAIDLASGLLALSYLYRIRQPGLTAYATR